MGFEPAVECEWNETASYCYHEIAINRSWVDSKLGLAA